MRGSKATRASRTEASIAAVTRDALVAAHASRFRPERALLVVAGLYVLVNFIIDMLYLVVDPRVRY